jgi:hypothetical protein
MVRCVKTADKPKFVADEKLMHAMRLPVNESAYGVRR